MRKELVIVTLVCMAFGPMLAMAQRKYIPISEVAPIMGLIKSMDKVSYDYISDFDYPDGQKERLEGTIFIDMGAKLLYNSCGAFVTVYSGDWYYRADHSQHDITVAYLPKVYGKARMDALEKDVFGNALLNSFIDSILLKYGHVKRYVKRGDTVNVDIGFDGTAVKGISICYDGRKKVLASYSMTTFERTEPWNPEPIGTVQTFACSNFRKERSNAKYTAGNFYTYGNGKVKLKKYNKYKLNTKI